MTEAAEALPHALTEYFDRTGVALALSSTADDVPLVLVNSAFCKLTGYANDDVIGQNCRLLQGPDTSQAQKDGLHDFIHDASRDAGRFHVLNYRKDQSGFHNFVFMTRLRDHKGRTRFILAS